MKIRPNHTFTYNGLRDVNHHESMEYLRYKHQMECLKYKIKRIKLALRIRLTNATGLILMTLALSLQI